MPSAPPRTARCRGVKRTATFAGGLFVCLLAGCTGLPKTNGRTTSHEMKPTNSTPLAAAARPLTEAHRGKSGLHPLSTGVDAFAARLALADAAKSTLELQYYIWHNDRTGRLMLDHILRASERGVHVRVLLDDLGKSTDEGILLALDAHPNIEVRLFNPVPWRHFRWLGALFDYRRVNRRMHNKAFVADGRVAIVGGRNIGDEYFAAHSELEFADLDVVAIGPVVDSVSRSFELFWNSRASIPIASLTRTQLTPGEIASYKRQLAGHVAAMQDSPYVRALHESSLATQIERRTLQFHWGRAWSVYDLPEKFAAADTDTTTHLLPKLRGIAEGTKRELFIVSPYFVPGRRGVKLLKRLRERGVRVVVVTNSLASTDVTAVHAVYERYRKPLLRAGVEIYESKHIAKAERAPRIRGLRGSRRASLHAKTFAFDRTIIFIGSMNLDPRSTQLNTEIGIVFDCPEFAAQVPEILERDLDQTAYRLELSGRRLTWIERDGKEIIRHDDEPGSTAWQRAVMRMLSWLPIESQL
jgi:putative cardiolipin synthase